MLRVGFFMQKYCLKILNHIEKGKKGQKSIL